MQLLRIDWNVVWTIINLLVLFVALRHFLYKPVMKVMDERKKMIDGQIADAENQKKQAGELKAQYAKKLEEAHAESADIMEKARKSAQAEYENRINAADAEAQRIIKDAHKTVELERDKTVADLQSEIAVLAVAAAGKVLGEASTSENNQLLYNQFLAQAGGVNDANS